jgi:hypothetical protein
MIASHFSRRTVKLTVYSAVWANGKGLRLLLLIRITILLLRY